MVMLSFNSASLGVPVTSWQRLQRKEGRNGEETLRVKEMKESNCKKGSCPNTQNWDKENLEDVSVPHLRLQVTLTSRMQTHSRLIAKLWHIPSPMPGNNTDPS